MSLLHAEKLGMALFLFALAAEGQAQGPSVIQLVPTSGWQLVRSGQLDLAAVTRFGGDPEIEREYGVRKLELRRYRHGTQQAEALIEEATDLVSAYGLLTFYRTEEFAAESGLDMAFLGPATGLMARGRTFIRVQPAAESELSRNDLRSLLVALGGIRLAGDEAEGFPAPLPQAGLIPHTEKYLLGLAAARRVLPDFRTDLIGFTQGAEVRMGTYSTRSNHSTVLAVNYPTPQIARVRYGAMESLLGVNQEKATGGIYGKRTGSFVFLVLHSRASEAEELLKQFQVTSDVSWNEPAPEAQRFAADLAQLILSILALVFAIAAAAALGGVLLVLSHRIARRYFPDSGWANPERDEVIRLNLQ